eukprot:scaffold159697_cov56-Cyclotella_meneghiniana.AAC.2
MLSMMVCLHSVSDPTASCCSSIFCHWTVMRAFLVGVHWGHKQAFGLAVEVDFDSVVAGIGGYLTCANCLRSSDALLPALLISIAAASQFICIDRINPIAVSVQLSHECIAQKHHGTPLGHAACIRRVLTLPDSRCEGARAHTSPALDPQKPWRHPPWRTKSAVSPQLLEV